MAATMNEPFFKQCGSWPALPFPITIVMYTLASALIYTFFIRTHHDATAS